MANILSLFDGISCGRVALERAKLKVDNYFASEIDKYAIQVAKKNYPDTIHIGDVTKVKYKDGVLITETGKYKVKIDMIMGGSPCQGFSFAGKQLNFQDERSKLFFEYVRILNEVQPKYFLLENVKMKQEYQDVISEQLSIEPIRINSSLVSAALRDRIYWTNIPNVKLPKDKGILLQNIIEEGFYTDREKARCILESESRPVVDKKKLYRRYVKVGFINIVFDNPKCKPNYNLRILSQLELERLFTLPEGYTSNVERNVGAGLMGNGWTVDVITHILNHIPRKRKDDAN